MKIVSGGQTGADRAGLDFAIENGIPHGGWCPKGRKAIDGPIDEKYQLKETPSANYLQRTEWNARDSDATVIFTLSEELTGGSKRTAEFAEKHEKPWVHIHPTMEDSLLADFLEKSLPEGGTFTLNIAGSREASEGTSVYTFTRERLEESFPGNWRRGQPGVLLWNEGEPYDSLDDREPWGPGEPVDSDASRKPRGWPNIERSYPLCLPPDLRPPTRRRDIRLGYSAPKVAETGTKFGVSFTAFEERYREEIEQTLRDEGQSSNRIDLDRVSQWKVGTRVTVALRGKGFNIDIDRYTFEWNGEWKIVRFGVETGAELEPGSENLLQIDVIIEGIAITSLFPKIRIALPSEETPDMHAVGFLPASPKANKDSAGGSKFVEAKVPTSAFASYSTKDKLEVMSRVRSVEIVPNIKVFVDCRSINPGWKWRKVIKQNLESTDAVWLFWSSHAAASKYVKWEWKHVLKKRSLEIIQPHPLEPLEKALPPKELDDLEFGAAFEDWLDYLRMKKELRED